MYSVNNEIVKKAIKFLKKDIYDDWFCDIQNFDDIFNDINNITNIINDKIRSGKGIYLADNPILFNIPKENGAFRYTLELCPLDRLAYHIFGIQLIHYLDRSLPFNVLGHRKNLDDKMLFKPMIEQWNKFENYTRISGINKHIIQTDISNYFDYININRLRIELINSASDANLSSEDFVNCIYAIESIFSILKQISFDGERGLPQNKDISSFLANIYMRPLDKCLKDAIYFRYMDDIRIIADTRADANRYMLCIIEELRKCGLSLNSSKTKILIPNSQEHSHFCFEMDLEAKKTDSLFNSGKRKYVMESFNIIYSNVLKYLDESKVNERKFRFYSNRLITFLNAKDVKVPNKFKKEISSKLIGVITAKPDSADKICALVKAIGPFKKLQDDLVKWAVTPDNLTYEWAVYTIIKTLIIQSYKSKTLDNYCKACLNDINTPDNIRGISAVYLNKKAKKSIINLLSRNNSHFFQRHLIIALSEMKPDILLQNDISEKIIPDFKGQHQNLYKLSLNANFLYVKEHERITQRELIQELKNYA